MKRCLADIIIFVIFFMLVLVLAGCARKEPVSETIANNAINATTQIEKDLPEQCKTEPIISQLSVIKTQIRAITNACETEKGVIEQEKRRYQWAFYGVLVVIGLFFAKKVLK